MVFPIRPFEDPERDAYEVKVNELLINTGVYLFAQELILEPENPTRLRDTHAFWRSKTNEGLVLHVQGYPGLSNHGEVYVSARLRDYEGMMLLRKQPRMSIGNEHNANIAKALDSFPLGITTNYNPQTLADLLIKDLSENERNAMGAISTIGNGKNFLPANFY